VHPSRVWPLVALVWCLLLARFAQAFVWPEAWGMSDDVYITAGAARSLWEGFGPVWYVGAPRVEGFSNPLWLGVLALLHGVPGFTEDRLGGLVFGVNLLLFCGLARACVRTLAGGGIDRGGVLLVLSPAAAALTYFAAEGFEVALVSWLAVLALDAAWRREPLRFALVVALGFWTRMDFLVLAVLPGLSLAAGTRGDPRRSRAFAIGALLIGLQFALRWSYFGEWLPNTAHLKGVGWPLPDRLLRGLAQNAWAVPSVVASLGVAAAALRWAPDEAARRRARLGGLAVSMFAVGFLYSGYVGGDFLGRRAGWDRFTAPGLPLLVLGLTASLAALPLRRASRPLGVLLLLGLVSFPAVATTPDRNLLDRRLFRSVEAGEPVVWSRTWRRVGKRYAEIADPGARMAVCAAGAIVYFSGRGGVDLLGKVDPFVARLPVAEPAGETRCWRDWPGHNKEAFAETFALRKPELSAVAPPRALRSQYRPVRYEGTEFWVLRTSPLVRWDVLRVAPGWPEPNRIGRPEGS